MMIPTLRELRPLRSCPAAPHASGEGAEKEGLMEALGCALRQPSNVSTFSTFQSSFHTIAEG